MSWDAESSTVNLAELGTGTCQFKDAMLVTDEKHEGSSSMRVSVNEGQGDDGCVNVFPQRNYGHALNTGATIHYRWWMKIQSSFNWGTEHQKTKAGRIKQATEVNPIYFSSNLHKTGISLQCAGCEPGFSGGEKTILRYDFNPSTNPAVTNWQEYIVQFRWQTGSNFDAEARLYVNGKLVASFLNWRVYSGSGMANGVEGFSDGMMLQSYSQLCSASCPGVGGFVWLDDFSVDDSWNSNAVARPLPPTMLPAK